jgi:acetyl-CoA carboxylase carboxyltransferase component
VLFSEEANKATEFIQLCNVYNQPLVFFHNVTGYMVGAEYEQGGIIKDGAKMVNAVANSTVPHIGIIAGASYGAGNYGMSGQAFNPRFLFMWPSAKVSVMGAEQLAGVMSIVNRAAAEARGTPLGAEQDEALRRSIEDQIHAEEEAVFMSAHNRDDGIIDPRDTRTVLGITLSAVHSNRVEGTSEWGVFRM